MNTEMKYEDAEDARQLPKCRNEGNQESVRWRAKTSESYILVNDVGELRTATEHYPEESQSWKDSARYAVGNYFRTEEEAKASIIYKAYNSLNRGVVFATPEEAKAAAMKAVQP